MTSDLRSEVAVALAAQGASPTAEKLWREIAEASDRGGSDAVRDLLGKKVTEIRSTARAQAREMKEAAGAVSKKPRGKKRR